MIEKIRRGVTNPRRVPPYLLGKLLPASRWGPSWKEENGIVTWRDLHWGDGETPAQVNAINYQLFREMRDNLPRSDYPTIVEIGSGYGRVTPWLSEFGDRVVGIEPNRDVLELAQEYFQPYTNISFEEGLGQDLPIADGAADLVFTRAVLQHIANGGVESIGEEIRRVQSPDGDVVLLENTDTSGSTPGKCMFPRTPEAYADLLGMDLRGERKAAVPAKTRKQDKSFIRLR